MSGAAARRDTAAATAPLRRLGTVPVAQFMARYWQQRALCIRRLFPAFASPLAPDALFALAADPDVESRLVTTRAGALAAAPWPLRCGPTARTPARRLDAPGPGGGSARCRRGGAGGTFRFVPAARFDDVMISFATAGGCVGPHVDQYDVFLLQAQGRRRWRIAKDFDPALVEGLPLRVLARFRHEQEWILEPGDALYLPPGVAHEGVAMDDCITISIGFRLPAWQEIAEAWQDHQSRTAPRAGRVPDSTRRPTTAPARLPAAMVDAVARELRRIAPSRRDTCRTLLEHLTEPKASVVFDPPGRALGPRQFAQAAARHGLRLDLRSRMLYQGMDVALNGELVAATPGMASLLRRLADQACLAGATHGADKWTAAWAAVPHDDRAPLHALLHLWYRSGWLHIAA